MDAVEAAPIEVVDRDMAAVLRTKSPAERLEIAFGMWRFARRSLRARLQQQHPGWEADRVEREVARRLASGSW